MSINNFIEREKLYHRLYECERACTNVRMLYYDDLIDEDKKNELELLYSNIIERIEADIKEFDLKMIDNG